MRTWGVLSIGVLVLTWLAGDDITTDNASTFRVEYTILVLAAVWFAVLGIALLRRRLIGAGLVSLAAVAAGVAACWDLPHHYQPFTPINFLVFAAIAWFLGLAAWLIARPLPAGASRPAAI